MEIAWGKDENEDLSANTVFTSTADESRSGGWKLLIFHLFFSATVMYTNVSQIGIALFSCF